jgi:hypothetical protein
LKVIALANRLEVVGNTFLSGMIGLGLAGAAASKSTPVFYNLMARLDERIFTIALTT